MNEETPRRLVHVERFPIFWGDMDALGHVNNVTYFRYMEQARVALFEMLAPAEDRWKRTPIVVVNASCDFRRPLVYPGDVEVSVFIEPPRRSSLRTLYEMRLAGDPHVYAEGSAVIVFIDGLTQRATAIPAAVREKLQALLR
ncbi:MAG TPA: thioesterase family protein [Usitatibacter sp.]|nr:thioesterase family protein [Usitatibacter sp.]